MQDVVKLTAKLKEAAGQGRSPVLELADLVDISNIIDWHLSRKPSNSAVSRDEAELLQTMLGDAIEHSHQLDLQNCDLEAVIKMLDFYVGASYHEEKQNDMTNPAPDPALI